MRVVDSHHSHPEPGLTKRQERIMPEIAELSKARAKLERLKPLEERVTEEALKALGVLHGQLEAYHDIAQQELRLRNFAEGLESGNSPGLVRAVIHNHLQAIAAHEEERFVNEVASVFRSRAREISGDVDSSRAGIIDTLSTLQTLIKNHPRLSSEESFEQLSPDDGIAHFLFSAREEVEFDDTYQTLKICSEEFKKIIENEREPSPAYDAANNNIKDLENAIQARQTSAIGAIEASLVGKLLECLHLPEGSLEQLSRFQELFTPFSAEEVLQSIDILTKKAAHEYWSRVQPSGTVLDVKVKDVYEAFVFSPDRLLDEESASRLRLMVERAPLPEGLESGLRKLYCHSDEAKLPNPRKVSLDNVSFSLQEIDQSVVKRDFIGAVLELNSATPFEGSLISLRQWHNDINTLLKGLEVSPFYPGVLNGVRKVRFGKITFSSSIEPLLFVPDEPIAQPGAVIYDAIPSIARSSGKGLYEVACLIQFLYLKIINPRFSDRGLLTHIDGAIEHSVTFESVCALGSELGVDMKTAQRVGEGLPDAVWDYYGKLHAAYGKDSGQSKAKAEEKRRFAPIDEKIQKVETAVNQFEKVAPLLRAFLDMYSQGDKAFNEKKKLTKSYVLLMQALNPKLRTHDLEKQVRPGRLSMLYDDVDHQLEKLNEPLKGIHKILKALRKGELSERWGNERVERFLEIGTTILDLDNALVLKSFTLDSQMPVIAKEPVYMERRQIAPIQKFRRNPAPLLKFLASLQDPESLHSKNLKAFPLLIRELEAL